MKKDYFITFDVGGTKILKSVVELSGRGYKFLDMEEEKNPRQTGKIRKIIEDYCAASRKKYRTNKVAISTAKIVNSRNKSVENAKNCYGADIFSYRFLERSGFMIALENDGRCFALGEYYFGKARNMESALTLTLGTGIGGGFIQKGKSLRGAHNSAMEASFIRYLYNKKYVEWESLFGGRGIEKRYYRLLKKRADSREIFAEAKRGNKAARKVIAETTVMLGIGITNLINILDPEIIVFGGGMSQQKKFVENAVEIARKNVFNKKANYKFAISTLGNKANLLGAASLFRQ